MSTKVQRALERTTDTKDLLIGAGVVSRTGEMFAKLFPGCPGNLKALSRLVEGQTPEWVIERVKGITCGPKPTSCSDQLATMLELVIEEEKKRQQA